METNSDTPKFYILQQYTPKDNIRTNDDGCCNIFYAEINGKDKIWFGDPEKATRYKTIGEAMKYLQGSQPRIRVFISKRYPYITKKC